MVDLPSCISVFAGRIADTWVDLTAADALRCRRGWHAGPNLELIWASPWEPLNIVQASEIGCHIITVTNDILKKIRFVG